MATTALVVGAGTVAVKGVSGAMGSSSKKQAAAAQQQDIAELQTQQADLAAQQQALAEQLGAAQQAAAQPVAAALDRDSLDYQAAEIQKLSAMKAQGLLTDEEFTAKKRQILGI
jgi:outer membrane murein-binding lipoprotein Lpp